MNVRTKAPKMSNLFYHKIVNFMQPRSHPPNQMVMSIEQIKETLHLRVEQADESFLRILHAMTEAYAAEYLEEEEITDEQIIAITANMDFKRLTKEELLNEIEEANAEIERGEFITIDDLEKEMEEW